MIILFNSIDFGLYLCRAAVSTVFSTGLTNDNA